MGKVSITDGIKQLWIDETELNNFLCNNKEWELGTLRKFCKVSKKRRDELLHSLDLIVFEQKYHEIPDKLMCEEFNLTLDEYKMLVKYLGFKRTKEERNNLRKLSCKLSYYNKTEEEKKQFHEKQRQGMFNKYGVYTVSGIPEIQQKRERTNLQKYGRKYGFDYNKVKDTIKERYRVENVSQNEDVKQRKVKTCRKNFGVDFPGQSDEIRKKIVQSNIQRYGFDNPAKNEEVIKKTQESRKRHFQENPVSSTNFCHNSRGSQSKPNTNFENLLNESNICHTRELRIMTKYYDFQIGKYVIEINPTATHNITWHPWNKDNKGIPKDYHYNKSKTAYKNGYRCVHVWDWDDKEEIIRFLGSLDDNTYFIDNHENNSIDLKSSDMKVLHSFFYSLHEQGVLNLGCNGIWNNYINNYFVQFVKANFYVNKIKLDLDLSKCFVPRFDNYKVLKQIKPQCYNITLGQDTSVDVYDCGRQIIEIEL